MATISNKKIPVEREFDLPYLPVSTCNTTFYFVNFLFLLRVTAQFGTPAIYVNTILGYFSSVCLVLVSWDLILSYILCSLFTLFLIFFLSHSSCISFGMYKRDVQNKLWECRSSNSYISLVLFPPGKFEFFFF